MLGAQRKEGLSWTGVEKEDLGEGVSDRTPGLQGSERRGLGRAFHAEEQHEPELKTSSVWAAWTAGCGDGACRGLRREEAGTEA